MDKKTSFLKILILLGIILSAVFLIAKFDILSSISSTRAYTTENIRDAEDESRISYPQICQLTIPDLKRTDKEDKLFKACWEVKIIYNFASYQINTLQKMIELIRDPDKGCNPNKCQTQCVDASCYAKDFHCGEGCPLATCSGEDCSVLSAECDCEKCPGCECQPDCIGHCSKYQTSYPRGSLPCKSDYIDFYNNNGLFRACPDFYLGNELVKKYYLRVEKAGDEVQNILQKEYDRESTKFKDRIKAIIAESKRLKELSQDLKDLTDKCQCSEKSLCEELSCGCLAKECSVLSQCSPADIQKIMEKIEEIEETIEELYYRCIDK